MKKTEFVAGLGDFCEFEMEGVTLDTPFKSIQGYDSLAVLSMIAYIDDHFGVQLTAQQFAEITDFNSLISLIGNDKFTNE